MRFLHFFFFISIEYHTLNSIQNFFIGILNIYIRNGIACSVKVFAKNMLN